MKLNDIAGYIRKNFLIIAVGLCALVLLIFLSENFGSKETGRSATGSGIEVKLESFLSQLQGVGECDVIIFTENKKTSSFSSTENETISGIAVVCDGGGNSAVKNMIIDVLTGLFGISGSRISINEKC